MIMPHTCLSVNIIIRDSNNKKDSNTLLSTQYNINTAAIRNLPSWIISHSVNIQANIVTFTIERADLANIYNFLDQNNITSIKTF